jgi:ribosome recycling factor
MKKNAEFDIQEITNNFISKIDQVFEIKQKEIMTV